MELEGVVHKVLEPVSGTSARGDWIKQEVVIEQPGEYSRMVCLSFWGDKAREAGNLKEGDQIKASINIESREFKERWYTEIRAWKFTTGQAAPPFMPPMPGSDMSAPQPQSQSSSEEDSFDDLPF